MFRRKSIEEETFGVAAVDRTNYEGEGRSLGKGVDGEASNGFDNIRVFYGTVVSIFFFVVVVWSFIIDISGNLTWSRAWGVEGVSSAHGSIMSDITDKAQTDKEQEMLVFNSLKEAIDLSRLSGYVVNENPKLLYEGVFTITDVDGGVLIIEAVPDYPNVIKLKSTEDYIEVYVLMTNSYWDVLEQSFDK